MNTRKYDSKTRKVIKREQQGPAYRELQERTKRDREALEAKLAQREKPLRDALNEARLAIGSFVQFLGPVAGGVLPEKMIEHYERLMQAHQKLVATTEAKPA